MARLFARVGRSCRVLLGTEWASRCATAFPDDVYLVSYPRSGNTWLRFLVGNLICPDEPVTFLNIEQRVPSIYVNSDSSLRMLSRPRILKSHEAFFSKYRNVVYLVRDPRDVAVSYYHYLVKYKALSEGYPIVRFIDQLIDEQFDDGFGTWSDHVLSWLAMQQSRDRFLLLRYEDILRDPARELTKLAGFLNVDATPERVQKAVELASADSMRRLERSQSRRWVSTRKSRQDKPLIRLAAAGEWKSALPEKSVLRIESTWGRAIEMLGYELAIVRSAFES